MDLLRQNVNCLEIGQASNKLYDKLEKCQEIPFRRNVFIAN